MKTYCGACGGERGCADCIKAAKVAEYTGLTQFFAKDEIRDESVIKEETDETSRYGTPKELLLVADLGTTTLAFVCGDETGTVRASYGMENPQRKTAADVIGRMDAALRGESERLTYEIKEALIKGFLFVLEKCKKDIKTGGAERDELPVRVSIAGNTTMQHLLLGYPVEGMAKAPFTPYAIDKVTISFRELFSNIPGYETLPMSVKEAEVTVFPCFSAFVGGDLVAGAYALFPTLRERTVKQGSSGGALLLMDLGTNGELLLFTKDKLYGTAAAMGSAFEGGRFAYASDLFRLVAEARKQDVLDETGLLAEPFFTEGFYGLSQEDIREFQLAKGALRAGIVMLCKRGDVKLDEVKQIYVAGGLGRYCRTEDLFDAGLLPKDFCGKVQVVGNSCLEGQLLCLKNRETMLYWNGEMLNLAEEPDFAEQYYYYMNFPS